jgi:hypothetical protein
MGASVSEQKDRKTSEGTHSFGDDRDEIVARCEASRLPYEIYKIEDDEEEYELRVKIHNGREEQALYVSPSKANLLKQFRFEEAKYLGSYEAVLFSGSDRRIEARLRHGVSAVPSTVLMTRMIQRLPGVEIDIESPAGSLVKSIERVRSSEADEGVAQPKPWRLRIESPSERVQVELSPSTDELAAMISRGNSFSVTAKIRGEFSDRHDDALNLMEQLLGAIFFEMDVRHGVALAMARRPSRPFASGAGRRRDSRKPQLPRVQYPQEALSLYTYARSASSLPLLEYLAYYQAIEYFFPIYAEKEALERLRRALKDPRFDPDNYGDLGRLFTLGANSKQSGLGTERDQLKATFYGCIDAEELRSFLEDNASMTEALSKDNIKYVKRLNMQDRNSEIRDQVANRVYDIRCRIVHAKFDDVRSPEILLPFGREAALLSPDLSLIRMLAQKVLINGGQAQRWSATPAQSC